MKFSELSVYLKKLEGTASRLAMTEVLAELYGKVGDQEMPVVVNLSLGQLRPKYDRLEFNLADKMVLRAIAEATDTEAAEVAKTFKDLGDIGEAAEELKARSEKLKTATDSLKLSIAQVYKKLVEVAEHEGEGSQERKVTGLAQLLQEVDGLSARYIARMVVGRLRLGFSDMTILDALSWMETGGKSKRKILEGAYQMSADVGELGRLVKKYGADGAQGKVSVRLGVPVVPALAQRLKTADEMIEKMGKVGVEAKFDGTRVQIHFRRFGQTQNTKVKSQNGGALPSWQAGSGGFAGKKWVVRTFTRNFDETTHMFPELLEIGKYIKADEVILDSEGIAYDPKSGRLRSFQDTIQRKRKHGIEKAAEEIPLKFFVFDVLYLNGKSLVSVPFFERRKILEEVIRPVNLQGPALLELPELLETEDPGELREFHKRQLGAGLEGALVKKWDGVYEPGRRGWSWVKFKESEDSKAKLSDTLDLLVMGLYQGKGKRTEFGVGAFLVGVRGGKSKEFTEGMFYTISKVGTGLSDDQWRDLAKRGKKLTVVKQPKEYVVDNGLAPDVWLSPGLVVEIAADEITKSPNHSAGVALRFPRLVKFRDDKGAGQVTSLDEAVQLGEI